MLCISGVLICLNGFAQESRIVFETKDFVITSEWVTYTFKDLHKKKVEGTKIDHYKLAQKGNGTAKQAEIKFEDAFAFNGSRKSYVVRQNGLSGMLDLEKGQVMIPCQYKSFSALNSSIISAQNKGQTLYDLEGKKLIETQFKDVAYYAPADLIYDKNATDLVLYNGKGTLVKKFPKTRMRQFHGQEMILEQNGKFGIFNTNGNEVLPFEYADAFFGENTLVLAKKSPNGIKYGMFTGSDLKTSVFPFESDYLSEITLTEANGTDMGFILYNAGTNALQILDGQKNPVTVFNRYASKKEGLAAAKKFISLEILYDYYIVATTDEDYRIYLKDGQSISSTGFSYYSLYENVFENYIFFIDDGKGHQTWALPFQYNSARAYHLPYPIYGITKLSDKAYLVDAVSGQNVFRPDREHFTVDDIGTEGETDYALLENYKTVFLSTYRGKKIAYDVVNDSLFLYHKGMQKNTFDIFFNYMSARLTPYFRDNPLKSDSTVEEIFSETSWESEGMFRYTDQYGNQVFPDSPYQFNFSKMEGYNAEGEFFLTTIEREEDVYYVLNTVLDSKLRMLKPYSLGSILNIYPFPNDTIIVSEFYGNPDSIQVYSTHWKKTVYYSQLAKLTGEEYIHPHVTPYGIMNDGSKAGLIGFKGELLVPFQYEFVTDDLQENSEKTVLDFVGTDGIHMYYFTKPHVMRKGSLFDREFMVMGSDAYFFPESERAYRIYNKNTGAPVLEQSFSDVEYMEGNRYLIVGTQGSFGIFDLKTLSLAEEIRFSTEQIHSIFEEKFSMEQLEEY